MVTVTCKAIQNILKTGLTEFQTAAYLGHLDVVVYLLSIGADVDVGEIGNRYVETLCMCRVVIDHELVSL